LTVENQERTTRRVTANASPATATLASCPSTWQGVDNAEIIDTVQARPAPVVPVSVDAIRLVAVATCPALAGHQPRRNPNHALAVNEQEPLEGARDMPAVLQRPHSLSAQIARPTQCFCEAAVADLDRLVAQQLARPGGHRGDRVRALVSHLGGAYGRQ
jgi:hypothetical protein